MAPLRFRSRLFLGWMLATSGVAGLVAGGPAGLAGPQAAARSGAARAASSQSERALKFETFQDTGKKFRWRLKSTNGQIIATSGQGYSDSRDCKSAIDRIKQDAATKLTFETYQDAEKKYRWRLRATNGQIIASSQGYKDKRDCENSIDVIKKGAEKAKVEEAASE